MSGASRSRSKTPSLGIIGIRSFPLETHNLNIVIIIHMHTNHVQMAIKSAAALGAEDLAAQAAVVLSPESGELLGTVVALLGLRIGHPETLQLRVLVVTQILKQSLWYILLIVAYDLLFLYEISIAIIIIFNNLESIGF